MRERAPILRRTTSGARARLGTWIAAVSLALAAASPAFAEPTDDELQKAKARFAEGLKFEESGDWKDALVAFQDVSKVKLTAQVRFKIAFSEEHLGRVLAATNGYKEALELAQKDPDKAQDVLTEAPKRIEALAPQIPRLTIRVLQPTEGTMNARVLVDERVLPPAEYGRTAQIEVGEHDIAIEITEPGAAPRREAIEALTIRPGEDKKLQINLGDFHVDKPPDPKAPEMIERHGSKVPAIIAGSIGIGGLVGSAIFLGLREAAISEVRDSCKDPENGTGCDPKLAPVAADGQTYTYVSASMLAVGVVGLGVGAVLWFTVGGKHMVPAPTQAILIGPTSVRFATTF